MTQPIDLTRETANTWLELAISNIQLEYPHFAWIVADSADDYAMHRDLHPTFFGSFDWHSCVEMYWVAIRIMRLYPDLPAEDEARTIINSLLTTENIAIEAEFCLKKPGFERPYGWGWALKLQHELDLWIDDQGREWSTHLRPLSDVFIVHFTNWLPKLTYVQRIGMHANTAFGLILSLPYVQATAPALAELFASRANNWFSDDIAYPFAYEPSGADFLSAGLTEAVLMQKLMAPDNFTRWIETFLPATGSGWMAPAIISDPTDGQIAHLHGLNLSRAWALGELAAAVPNRREELLAMRIAHMDASLDAVSGSHYMVAHWVVAYALLLFTEP